LFVTFDQSVTDSISKGKYKDLDLIGTTKEPDIICIWHRCEWIKEVSLLKYTEQDVRMKEHNGSSYNGRQMEDNMWSNYFENAVVKPSINYKSLDKFVLTLNSRFCKEPKKQSQQTNTNTTIYRQNTNTKCIDLIELL
jgi:hypothetical protein